MYHRTKHENVESILKHGLNCNDGGYICLSFNPDSWWTDYALFKVDIIGLEPEDLKVWPIDETDEMCIWIKNIPPDRLKLVTDNKSKISELILKWKKEADRCMDYLQFAPHNETVRWTAQTYKNCIKDLKSIIEGGKK